MPFYQSINQSINQSIFVYFRHDKTEANTFFKHILYARWPLLGISQNWIDTFSRKSHRRGLVNQVFNIRSYSQLFRSITYPDHTVCTTYYPNSAITQCSSDPDDTIIIIMYLFNMPDGSKQYSIHNTQYTIHKTVHNEHNSQ